MTDAEALVWHAEHNLGADHVSGQAKGVNLRSRHCRPARFRSANRLVDRDRAVRVPHLRQPLRELARRAARRIDFVVVRVVDDLPLSRRGSPTTSPRTRPACVRETAATTARSDVRAIPRASSDPAHPVAPARHTLTAILCKYVGKSQPRQSIWLGEQSRIRSWRHRRCCRYLSISQSVDRDTGDACETSHRC
jgi:hypothetical protein